MSNFDYWEDEYLDNEDSSFQKITHKKPLKQNKGSNIQKKRKEKAKQQQNQMCILKEERL